MQDLVDGVGGEDSDSPGLELLGGVSANIIEASWQALSDSVVWALLHAD